MIMIMRWQREKVNKDTRKTGAAGGLEDKKRKEFRYMTSFLV